MGKRGPAGTATSGAPSFHGLLESVLRFRRDSVDAVVAQHGFASRLSERGGAFWIREQLFDAVGKRFGAAGLADQSAARGFDEFRKRRVARLHDGNAGGEKLEVSDSTLPVSDRLAPTTTMRL